MKDSKSMQDLLWYSYFGITKTKAFELYKTNPKQAILLCAWRACRDIQQTLRFSENDEKKQQAFYYEICKYISDNALRRYRKENIDLMIPAFCEEICKLANASDILEPNPSEYEQYPRKFYGGQALRWVCMTFKYMRLMGFWNRTFAKKEKWFPIPIDSIVMEQASKEFHIQFRRKHEPGDDTGYSLYDADISQPWEKWDTSDYYIFIEKLRSKMKDGITCAAWEEKLWTDRLESTQGAYQKIKERMDNGQGIG